MLQQVEGAPVTHEESAHAARRMTPAHLQVPAAVRTVVCGHTHMPFQRLVDRRLVLNPGSIGMPYGRRGAHWALLDGRADEPRAELRRSSFDVDAAIEQIADSGLPDAREWAREFLTSANSDVEAIRVFGPRDGRPA